MWLVWDRFCCCWVHYCCCFCFLFNWPIFGYYSMLGRVPKVHTCLCHLQLWDFYRPDAFLVTNSVKPLKGHDVEHGTHWVINIPISLRWRFGGGNALVLINAVALHRARLVLGWVTAFGYGKLSHYITSHPGQLSLAIPPWVGAMSTGDGYGHR